VHRLDEDRLRGLLEAGRALVAELDVDAVLDRLLDVARDLTGAQYAAMGVLNEARTGLERFVTRGVDEPTHREIGDLPRGRGILGVLIEEPFPLRLDSISSHPRSYGFPVGHPPMNTFLGVPVLIRGEAWGNLYLTEKAGGESFDDADEQSIVMLAAWAGIAIENARLYEQVGRRRDELERAVRSLEATTAIARAIGADTRLERVLELVVKRARALVDARAVAVLLSEPDGLHVRATAGEISPELAGEPVALEPEAVVTGFRSRPGGETVDDALGLSARGALLVPLSYRDRRLGVLAAYDKRGGGPHFDDEDQGLMRAFAASAATAVAVAQSVAQDRLRQSIDAAEAERRRWARELHDQTLQGLAALRLVLSAGLGADEAALRAAATEAIGQIGEEIANLRSLIAELRPPTLDQLGLEPALEAVVSRAGVTNGLETEFSYDLAERPGPDLESTIYRIVQEALTNVGKHARAERVVVEVHDHDGLIVVRVADDGVGVSGSGAGQGFGLVGMRERVELAGGDLELRSDAGGTTLVARIPAPAGAGAGAPPQSTRP
jgi:signal transduction histidine kinase